MTENKLYTVELVQIVKVRKYPVDEKKLIKILRAAKKECGISNKEIASKLQVPLTQVAHWFRLDGCSAIPPAHLWEQLREILNITDTSYDKSITEFEYKEGVYDMGNRAYLSCGICPTITTQCNNIKIVV